MKHTFVRSMSFKPASFGLVPLCLALVLVFSCLFGAPAEAAHINKVCAVVNGKAITMFDLQRNALPEMQRASLNPNSPKDKEKVDAILRKVLDMMILDILYKQEAQRLKIVISDRDVDKEITDMYTQQGMTKEQFEKALKRQGLTLAEVRENNRVRMIRQRIMSMEVGRRVVVTQDEIRDYYEKHKDTMFNREGLHMALIVYHPQAPASTIARKLKNGEISWMEASKKYSVLPNRNQGGDGGPVMWDRLNPEWRARLTSMQPGDVTPLFNFNAQLKAQVRLFRPNGDQTPLRIMTLEEATPMIDGILRNPKAAERLEDYNKQLREKAIIDIRL